MKVGIYPGSFDPITKGHLDIIERAAKLVPKLVVAVLVNPNKKQGLLSDKERVDLIELATQSIPNIEVVYFSGLLVDLARLYEDAVVIRGIRSGKDLEMELDMAQINWQLGKELETIFLMTAPQYSYVSSSVVRELMAFGGDIKAYVPESVYDRLEKNHIRGESSGRC